MGTDTITLNKAQLKSELGKIEKTGTNIIDTHDYNFECNSNNYKSPVLEKGIEAMKIMDDIISLYKTMNIKNSRDISKAAESLEYVDQKIAANYGK